MITQAQRDAYRYALEDKGVPEVIAFIAAQNLSFSLSRSFLIRGAGSDLVMCGFVWFSSPEGAHFWAAVMDSLS